MPFPFKTKYMSKRDRYTKYIKFVSLAFECLKIT